jgi:hypothetical protein
MKTGYILAGLVLLLAAAQATYVVEWSATGLVYSMAYVYSGSSTSHYDVNGDSIPDIFITDSTSLKIYSGVSHSLIWTIPGNGYDYIGFPYVGNTDGDPAFELVLLCYSYSPSYIGKFFVYDCSSHNLEYTSPQKSGYLSMAVADVDGDGKNEICIVSGTSSRILEVYGSTDAACDEQPAIPALHERAAVPNPATGLVRLVLPQVRGPALVEMTDAAGRVVRSLAVSGPEAVWDCRDDRGEPVPSGVYVWRCGSESGSVTVCH